MWGRRKNKAPEPRKPEGPLRDALREARIAAAERTDVVVDLRDAEIAQLELLNDEIEPVFAEIPDGVELFDRGISRGDTPRLWLDAVAHVEMGRDKREYRFVQDTRFGRRVLAESAASRDIVEAITRYAARRLIERERALAGDAALTNGSATSPYGSRLGLRPAGRARRRGILIFALGLLCGAAGLLIAAWIAALLGR